MKKIILSFNRRLSYNLIEWCFFYTVMLVEQDFRWLSMSMTCLFDYLFTSEEWKSFAVRQDLRCGRLILLQKCTLAECIWVYNDSMRFGQIYLPNSKSGEFGFGHIYYILEIHLEDVTTCWGNF